MEPPSRTIFSPEWWLYFLMQETATIGSANPVKWDILSRQGLVALLALVGTRRMAVEDLRGRTRLTPSAFGDLLSWLQREYLVDVIAHLEGDRVVEKVELTEKGEAVLVSMLEKTCELPEFR
jgi:DNA-binding MarR family transcriptional regulator